MSPDISLVRADRAGDLDPEGQLSATGIRLLANRLGLPRIGGNDRPSPDGAA